MALGTITNTKLLGYIGKEEEEKKELVDTKRNKHSSKHASVDPSSTRIWFSSAVAPRWPSVGRKTDRRLRRTTRTKLARASRTTP